MDVVGHRWKSRHYTAYVGVLDLSSELRLVIPEVHQDEIGR